MSAALPSRRAKITLVTLLLLNTLVGSAAAHRAGALRRAWASWEARRSLRATTDGEALVRPTARPPAPRAPGDDARCALQP